MLKVLSQTLSRVEGSEVEGLIACLLRPSSPLLRYSSTPVLHLSVAKAGFSLVSYCEAEFDRNTLRLVFILGILDT